MTVTTVPAEYAAATERAIVLRRADRGVVRVFGRDPVKMVHGLVTNDVQSLTIGSARYAVMLTVKGRMLADVRIVRRAADLLIEASVDALPHVQETLRKFVPPLFAKSEDVSATLAVVGIYGPTARDMLHAVLTDAAPGDAAESRDRAASDVIAQDLVEDDAVIARFANEAVHVIRTGETAVGGYDIIVPVVHADALVVALDAAGALPASPDTVEVLRIEAGRPRWGAELGEDVIPIEAGLLDRAISTTKGCYTGQEVIVRILHRGHVNRHLRGLFMGEAVPAVGTELFREGDAKSMGRITSACRSPRFNRAVALGYVRREVEPGAVLRAGSPDGAAAEVTELPFGPAD